jgi:hypothetical protein
VQDDQLIKIWDVQDDQLIEICDVQDYQLIARGGKMADGVEAESGGPMLVLHRSLAHSLYKSRLQESYNMWSCIIVFVAAMVGYKTSKGWPS